MTTDKVPNLTPKQFRQKLRALTMTQRSFAAFVQVDIVTVNRWATGRYPVPHWVRLLLDAYIEASSRVSEKK